VVFQTPPTSDEVPQVCRPDISVIKESGTENAAPLIVTVELVKLTVAELPENLGLKTALNQSTFGDCTGWLLKCVVKQTPGPQGGGGVGVDDGEVVGEVVVDGGGWQKPDTQTSPEHSLPH
jgi:hypothetical protein